MEEGRDVWFHEALEAADAECEPEPLDAEHPLFVLYTSGSTAKPKGVLHTTGGYLVGVTFTHRYVFDLKPGVRRLLVRRRRRLGHRPQLHRLRAALQRRDQRHVRGRPDYPDKDIWWALVERYGVTILYTAPTAIRACMKWGAEHPGKHDLSSARLLGSVGEPINPKAWLWYYKVIGGERCPIVDTWWQTETGSHPDQPPAGGHRDEARLGDQAAAGHRRRGGRRGRQEIERGEQGSLVFGGPGRDASHPLPRGGAFQGDCYGRFGGRRTWSATRPARTRTATSGSWGGSTT